LLTAIIFELHFAKYNCLLIDIKLLIV